MNPRIRFALFAACLFAALPVQAEVRALLVGVGDYQHLDADLRGPVNDVALMAQALKVRGADSIAVLADPAARLPEGIAPSALPTRAAILEGLGDLAGGAGPGDTVIFYFSGHGARVPDTNVDAADGYDDILLPADARGWNDALGAVESAIVDDELQPLFQAILDTGATLVAITDASHSASSFRALGSAAGTGRFVSDAVLGVPEVQAPPPAVPRSQLNGSYAVLNAAQPGERAFEFALGDSADLSNWYGDFTRALARSLGEVPDLTWAEALANATRLMQNSAAVVVQTPRGEGAALDLPVFGAGVVPDRRIAFEAGRLRAGLLAGFVEGAVFDLYPDAPGSPPTARAVLRDVGADQARLEVESGVAPASGHGVQLRPGPPAPFRLSVPVILDPTGNGPVLDALGALTAAELPEGVVWNAPDPDGVLILSGGQLALAGPDGVLDPDGPYSTPRMGSDTAAFFERAAQAHRLRRALALAETRAPGAGQTTGQTTGLIQRVEHEIGHPGADGCDEALAGVGPFQMAQPVGHCDRLWLSLNNTSDTAQDVTVLYVQRDFETSVLWPKPDQGNRIEPGGMQEIAIEIRMPDNLPGQEELIVIAVPARPGAAPDDLSVLGDSTIARGAEGASALQLYLEAAIAPAFAGRNLPFTGPVAPISVTRTRLHLVPGPQP